MRNKFLGTGQVGFHPMRKVRTCASGFRYAVLLDISVIYKLVLSLIVLSVTLYFRHWMDFLLVFVVTGLMVIAEMFNTTIEALCDFVETNENEKIAIIKDISAAAVGVSILIWTIVFLVEIGKVISVVTKLPQIEFLAKWTIV